MEAKMLKYFDEWAEELQEFRKWKIERMKIKDNEVQVISSHGDVKNE